MDDQTLEERATRNIKLLRWSFKWIPLLWVLLLFGSIVTVLISAIFFSETLIKIILEHPAAIIGIPISALVSLSLVLSLEQVGGPIVFKMPGVEFKGASGQVVLWLLCFMAIVFSIKMLW